MVKKFDIMVYDQDNQVPPKPEYGVMAESPLALQGMYKMCGQRIQIIKTYSDDDCANYGKTDLKALEADMDKPLSSGSLGGGTGFMKLTDEQKADIEKMASSQKSNTEEVEIRPLIQAEVPRKEAKPPKFFQVGGIKCKIENGKLYQKQWMKLTDEESTEIRIVSDKNNKICQLKDKHFEVLKWVIVEDDKNVMNTTVVPEQEKNLELING